MAIDLKKKSISLKKGEAISLKKPEIVGNDIVFSGAGFVGTLRVGLGWDPVREAVNTAGKGFFGKLFGGTSQPVKSGPDVDCDSFAIGLRDDGRYDNHVYFGNQKIYREAIRLLGDNLTGEGEGDDETILIDLSRVPVNRIVIGMNIYHARSRGQSLGSLQNAFIRLVDEKTGVEIAHYDITHNDGDALGLKFVELFKDSDGLWYCKTIDETFNYESISELVSSYK